MIRWCADTNDVIIAHEHRGHDNCGLHVNKAGHSLGMTKNSQDRIQTENGSV